MAGKLQGMGVLNVIFAVIFLFTEVYGEAIHHRPESIFPQNYNKYEPPTKEGEPAAIYISITVLEVDSIDEEKMEYSFQVHFTEVWKDERLNLSSYLVDFKVPRTFEYYLVEHMWEPDLIFGNSKDGRLFDLTLPNKVIKVMQDGSFMKDRRYNLIINCPMNLQFYPMDIQNCFFTVSSLSFTDEQLMLHWVDEHPIYSHLQDVFLPYKMNPLKYELTDIVSSKSVEIWAEGNFTFLQAKFTFTRRITSAIFNIYIPSTLVVLLSWISFWLDVEDVGARVTLGVTSLLTLTTQVVQVHSDLPPISYLTAVDIWLFACLIGVFSVFVEFAFAYQFFLWNKKISDNTRSNDDAILKSEIRISKHDFEMRILKFESRTDQEIKIQSSEFSNISRSVLNYLREKRDLDKISRKAFPLLFLVFTLVYWIYLLSYQYEDNSEDELHPPTLLKKGQ